MVVIIIIIGIFTKNKLLLNNMYCIAMLLLGYYSDLIHIGLTCFHSILDHLMAISGVLYF